MFLVQVSWVVAMVPAMVVGVHARGIVGAGIAHLVVALVVVLPAYAVTLHRQGVSLLAMVRAAFPPVAAALVAGGAVWASTRAIDVPWRALVIGSSIGLLIYLALLHRWLRARLAGNWPTGWQRTAALSREAAG